MPQPDSSFSASKIVVEDHNEDVDIDLSMNYLDDEIVLNGNQHAAYIDNSYEAGIGGLQVMQPPMTSPMVAASAPPAVPQPLTFQVQVPQGVSPGMQIQVAHPQTGQMLVVAVPQGVPPGGVFSVAA